MKPIYRLILLTILFLMPAMVLALSPALPTVGPVVPCVGCENLSGDPYPETGLWSNPEQSPGSGLNFEVQNGVLAGYLYSYSDAGQPEWLIVSGTLVRSETDGVVWELDTRLTRVEGGSCIDCQFNPPDQITSGKRIVLEFKQRNYLRVKIYTDGLGLLFDQHYVPFTYGSAAKAYFSEQTPYLMPVIGEGLRGEVFLLSGQHMGRRWESEYGEILGPSVSGSPDNRTLIYGITNTFRNMPTNGTEPHIPLGQIICALDENVGQPSCIIEMWGRTYKMPIGNFGDSRFFAEAEDGSIIEAFRIEYD